jgi:hypothetical protein
MHRILSACLNYFLKIEDSVVRDCNREKSYPRGFFKLEKEKTKFGILAHRGHQKDR